MNIIELNKLQNSSDNTKLNSLYVQLESLLNELKKKELTPDIINAINQDIEELNAVSIENNDLRKLAKQKQTHIMNLVEKELKIVPKNYYRNLWLVVGMSAFGVPMGVAFGLSMGNMGLLGIGLPIGMAIGIAIGTSMDKKAFENGKQLDLEIKF